MTRALKITRGHATGNDFVLFSDPAGAIDLTNAECAAFTGAIQDGGVDGVIRAVRSAHIPEGHARLETDPDSEWFMDHRNPDGTSAELCGNALRVFVAFLMADGLVDLTRGDRIAIGTRDGVKDVQVGSNGVFRVDLGRWRFTDDTTNTKPTMFEVNRASDALDTVTVEPFDPLVDDGIGRLSLRMNYRVTHATHSWATIAATAALATRHRLGPGAPHNWRVDMPDGSLGVQMFPTEDGEHVSLSGTVELAGTDRIGV
jgi:diaminopimelate epimerase